MDLYSEKLDFDTIISLENENQVHEESELGFERRTVSQGSSQATVSNTESSTGSINIDPPTKLSTESGSLSQESFPATEIHSTRGTNTPNRRIDNQQNAPTTVLNTKVTEAADEKGDQENCSKKVGQSKSTKQVQRRKRSKGDSKPIRESKRKRKCPQMMNYESNVISSRYWLDDDKIKLLRGLEEFGDNDVESIKTYYLPKKTESAIHNQIRSLQEAGRNEIQRKLLAEHIIKKKYKQLHVKSILKLDEWIEHFENLHDISPQSLFALSNVFLLISEYGDLPEPNECFGINLRAMYRYLHCMLNGKPYFGMNQRTAKVLYKVISYTLRHTLCHREKISKMDPGALHILNENTKTYRPTKASLERGVPSIRIWNPTSLLKLHHLNPLSVPSHLLAKRELESDSDDFCSDVEENDKDNEEDTDHNLQKCCSEDERTALSKS